MIKNWDYETEVAIIGAGAAGPTVGVWAHDAGAKVLILESMPEPGGDVRLAGGFAYAAGTSIQKALGVRDSPDRMYKLYMAACKTEDEVDLERMRMVADGSAEVIEWLIGIGLKIPAQIGTPGLTYGGIELLPEIAASVLPTPGAHSWEGRGEALHDALLRQVSLRGIEILTETRARELIVNPDGEIIGIKAESKGGTVYIRAKRAVVICSGHFADNQDLRKLYTPELGDLPTFTAPGLKGDGLIMAQAYGAAVANIGVSRVHIGLPSIGGKAHLISRWHPCIMVNKEGKRFINEHISYAPLARTVMAQKDSMCFVIFDEEVKKHGSGDILHPALSPDLSEELRLGLIKTAPTVRGLANEIGVPPAELETTFSTYNANAKLGKDPEFGAVHYVAPVSNPPFYAIKGVPVVGDVSGGLKTNTKTQVLNVFGRVIPRLYAVGSVASFYKYHPGSGSQFSQILVFGRIAGTHAASEPLK